MAPGASTRPAARARRRRATALRQQVSVLDRPAAGPLASRTQPRRDRPGARLGGRLVVVHDRVAARRLVAREPQRVDRERVCSGVVRCFSIRQPRTRISAASGPRREPKTLSPTQGGEPSRRPRRRRYRARRRLRVPRSCRVRTSCARSG